MATSFNDSNLQLRGVDTGFSIVVRVVGGCTLRVSLDGQRGIISTSVTKPQRDVQVLETNNALISHADGWRCCT